MTKRVVVFHHDDNDGCCAAWVVKHYYEVTEQDAEVITVPVQYSRPAPLHHLWNDTILYIVDFSYKRDQLLAMKKLVKEIHVFDHHATAKAELEGLDFAKFSDTKAGAGMTWDILFNNQEPPAIVKLVDDYDLWKFDLPGTEAFHAISTLHDTRSMEFWDKLYKFPETLDQLLSHGHEKLYFENIEIDDIINSDKIKFGKFTAPGKEYKVAIYQTTHNLSKIGNKLLKKHPEIDFTICWFIVPKDGKIVFSLRCDNTRELDVGKDIAHELGGGGHKNAAGFTLPISGGLSFVDLLYA
ncbi:MAG: DHHA1 domain-containing protein [Aurantimicrobium sp.]|uniref:DHHA1 domain-containing protein n=1 Tax=Aurantimicrobium sp. TaxID=1930784 RepID=UPI002FC6571F